MILNFPKDQGPKWSQIVLNGPKLFQLVPNGLKLSQIVTNCPKSQFIPNDLKWF